MCTQKDNDEDVSQNAIGQQLLEDFSVDARKRMLKKSGIKRKRFEEQELRQFSIVDKEKKRWKYSDEDIEGLRGYMVENTYTRDSPMQNHKVVKKDYNGESTLATFSF